MPRATCAGMAAAWASIPRQQGAAGAARRPGDLPLLAEQRWGFGGLAPAPAWKRAAVHGGHAASAARSQQDARGLPCPVPARAPPPAVGSGGGARRGRSATMAAWCDEWRAHKTEKHSREGKTDQRRKDRDTTEKTEREPEGEE